MSNPVRASESQDEAKPLLGDAEQRCDDVVEAIGFGNWSLLLVILLGFLFMGDSIEATLLSFLYDPAAAEADGATPHRDARRPQAAHSIGLERSLPKRSRRAARAASVWAGVAAAAGAGAGATGAGAGATGGAPPPGGTRGTST